MEEAQNLSKFYQLSGIVSVKDFFYENGTGYIVMEYIDGINLKQYLEQSGGRIEEARVKALMRPVLESLMEIHETGFIHRDISPDNVMVDRKNRIKLIDFGSVRDQSTVDEKTYTVTLKHGYAPPEQYYAKGKQGPWTDIYSICATIYRMLTGKNPPNSIERLNQDEYVSPSNYGVKISQQMEYVLRKGLSVKAEDRYQSIGYLMQDLYYNNLQLQNNGIQNNNQYQNTNMQNNNRHQNTNMQNSNRHQNSSMQNNNQYPYNQQYTKPANGPKKSKKWIPIIVTSILAVVLIVVISSVVKSKDKEDDKDNDIRKTETVNASEANITENVVQNNTSETDTGIYSENGIKLVLPELYEYDAANSEDGLLMYEKDGVVFNTVAVVSYFGDTYMFLIYMDLDIDKGDSEYYSAMNTLQYIE